jgi:hypothetical protein
MSPTPKISTKWRNFALSGHTVCEEEELVHRCVCLPAAVAKRTNFPKKKMQKAKKIKNKKSVRLENGRERPKFTFKS